MPEIRETNDIVTQITTVKVPQQHQAEVLQLMAERAGFMATNRVRVGEPAQERGRQPCRELRAMERPQKTRGRSPFARVPQEMAALRRARQRGRAVPLSSHPRGGLNRTDFPSPAFTPACASMQR